MPNDISISIDEVGKLVDGIVRDNALGGGSPELTGFFRDPHILGFILRDLRGFGDMGPAALHDIAAKTASGISPAADPVVLIGRGGITMGFFPIEVGVPEFR